MIWIVTAWNDEPARAYPFTMDDLSDVKFVQTITLKGHSFRILNPWTNAEAIIHGTAKEK